MTSLLERIAPTLAIKAVVAPLTIYGLHRIFPAPNVGFLAIASTVNVCTAVVIAAWGREHASQLQGFKQQLCYRLAEFSSMSAGFTLPIFANYVGQRMGIKVPGYLETLGYVCFANFASRTVEMIYDLTKAYNSLNQQKSKT